MVEYSLKLYSEKDVLTVLAYLAGQEPDAEVVKTCGELATKIYWEHKDLVGVVAVSLCGLTLGWKAAEAHKGSAEAPKILSCTKGIAYNLASFTWPGWDEAGVEIGQTDLALGLAAAHTNLRLAQELHKGHLLLARAYWMLAAHCLAQKDYIQAEQNFAQSVVSATAAESQTDALLAEGYQVLVQLLQGTIRETQAKARMQDVKNKLLPLEGGPEFVEQLDTAYRVFTAKP